MTGKITFQSLSVLVASLFAIWQNNTPEHAPFQYPESASLPVACDTTFLKSYGTPFEADLAFTIAAAPGGGFFVAGQKGSQAMISLLDADANLIWTRQFNPTSDADDQILKIKLDSDGHLIGVGQTKPVANNVEVFAFKYDWQNDQMIWLNELDIADPALEGYTDILEKAPGGNFFIIGQTTPVGSTVSNALLLEVDRNTGFSVFAKTFNLIEREVFNSAAIFNNSLYAAGTITTAPAPNIQFNRRPSLTRFDLNGNQLWTKVYLKSIAPGVEADILPYDMIGDDGMTVFGAGNPDGTWAIENILFLFKTDADGNLQWAREIEIPAFPLKIPGRMIRMPDGYVCMGTGTGPGVGDANIFIVKTDLQGNLLWSKSYGNQNAEIGKDLLWQNNLIYLTGSTDPTGSSNDVLVANINDDGTSYAAGNCNLLNDLTVNISDWQNPYEGQHNLTETSVNANFFSNTITTQTVTYQQQTICLNPCCETKPDAVFQNAFAECAGDSLTVTLTICNEGFSDFPEGAYISFYSGNPTAGLAPLIGLRQTPQAVEPDSCLTFSVKIPEAPPPIFIVVNDQGTFPQPIDLAGVGPTTDIEECDFTNNIGTLDMANIPAPVNLGPDTLGCPGDTLLLTASGFDHYEWFPKNLFVCDSCASQFVVPQPDSIFEIIVVASIDNGCFSADTVRVGATERVFTFDTVYFCPGDTALIFGEPVTEPGEYVGVFPRAQGCDSIHQISLKTASNLLVQLPEDLTIELGDSVLLDPLTNGLNLTWQWSPPDGLSCVDCRRPWARPFETTRYTLTVTDDNGCKATGEMLLTVLLTRRIFIPNAFSPNGDGINDVFLILAGGNVARVRSFQLFDRWGEKIFEDFNFPPNDPAHGWDGFFKGKLMNPAVFVYKAEVEYVDGMVEVFQGDVALVR